MDLLKSVLEDLRRRDGEDTAKVLLDLLQDPFSGQIAANSVWYALGTSVGFTVGIALCFSFVRPYNQVVYAPRLKHADEKHAPPPLGKGIFSWIKPLWSVTETELVHYVGLDATVFLRFTIMCRNIFLVCSVLGCGILIPINMTKSIRFDNDKINWLQLLTPANVYDQNNWAQVVLAWCFNIVICSFLWWNYKKILQLRLTYFRSDEYQHSLHARTLMLYDIPKSHATDEGIARIVDQVAPSSSFSRTAVARNVRDLPDLIAEHEKAVRALEKVLAKYLKDPHKLPATRPLCKPSKKDTSHSHKEKIDAIDYWTQRIRTLELHIKEVRMSVDRRKTMPYGFASYDDIAEAHSIAYSSRKKHPKGATITLAPKPNDIIWDNMPLDTKTRAWRRTVINLWITVLTLLWIAPNAMIAIFLTNLNNLGKVWPAFQTELQANKTFWTIVQGVLSPAITSLLYLVLPIIFRRLSIRAGDNTKTGRERHVLAKLYSFFIFNFLIVFSLFGAIWSFVATVVSKTQISKDAWKEIVQENFGVSVFLALIAVTPFWVTWLLQRQLGAAIDLAQFWKLFYSWFMRKFTSPTPRELIELTAPPPFEYASYYNYFLFYSTVALCFAGIQPLVLPSAGLYFAVDVWLKKYLLLYIFVTKTESGGMFWRVLFNRMLFATILSNLVIFLIVWVRGDTATHYQAFAVAPLPFLVIAFKIYCARVFDDKIHYYSVRNVAKNPEGTLPSKELRSDRLASKFGHPALYRSLITPMVHSKAQNVLPSVYAGRLTDGREAGGADGFSVSGYSDSYVMDSMKRGEPGKAARGIGTPGMNGMPGFELVPENKLDFEYYKNRDEFAQDHGAGDIFARPGTPSMYGGSGNGSDYGSRPGTPTGGRRVFSPLHTPIEGGEAGMTYPAGYAPPAAQGSAFQPYQPGPTSPKSPRLGGFSSIDLAQPAPAGYASQRSRSPLYSMSGGSESASNLVQGAAAMPMATPGTYGHGSGPGSRERSLDRGGPHAPGAAGMLGGGPYGYGNLPQHEADEDPMSYDYFRGRSRRPGN